MPLDGHGYLVNQGWSGKGKGLREGAISRPLAIPQKKTLSGLGKDRDEAFPFWDHLFSAAAKSIQVKCLSDDEDSETSSNTASALKRTSTGILSNRRPLDGTPATSGSSTPFPDTEASRSTLSLMATAKRDAAKRGLYSRFFRGPVLGPDSLADEEKRLTAIVTEVLSDATAPVQSVTIKEHIDIETSEGHTIVDLEVSGSSKKKRRKAKDIEEVEEDEEASRERKRRKREEKKAKERDQEEKMARKEAKRAKKLAKLKAEEQPNYDRRDLKKHKSEVSRKEKRVSEVNGIQLVGNPKKKKRKRDSSGSEIT